MNFKVYSIIILALLFHNCAFSQNENPFFQFGVNGGFNVSKIKLNEKNIKNVGLPFFGINALFNITQNFGLKAGMQNSYRGANLEKPIRKYRINYFDNFSFARIRLLPYLFAEIGGQYSILFLQYYKILYSQSSTGEGVVLINNYHSRPEFKVGLDLQLEKRVNIFAHYSIPNRYLESSNVEFGISLYVTDNELNGINVVEATSLDELFADPLKYTSLVVHRKEIKELPPEIGKCLNLEEIYLDGNLLTTLPKEIGNLINLKTLSVKANQLIYLPDEIGNLKNLETLKLNFNKLQKLPTTIGNLENLKFLLLADNRISYLPEEFGNLTNLAELDIYEAGLLSTPYSMKNLKKIERIYCTKKDETELLLIFPKLDFPRLKIVVERSDY